MEIPEFAIAIMTFIVCILAITACSIGIKAYNKNKEYKEKNKPNDGFLVFNLVVSIIIACVALFVIILNIKNKYYRMKSDKIAKDALIAAEIKKMMK